ncbi:MAG: hypothetical protein GFH27_549279n284 [Chloroflexi bacterium AL-W]|nr:hypothetical protein [Chloroflexi bacterium AL-N1]NOK65250.1 hypothetical protein [Chloroflexi bacterium AL-N10]NOK72485.1 hypothetical protein [Chloroflexi bacterium AL-N5]NOK79429.1 hypothetical protein [Chloroflexi bacterium AL-W]NOK87345.1 hypothetical protein [Chloroflexi bacterium AL-N15]
MTELDMTDPYPNQPSSARIYDYWLGGTHNFEVDRQAAEQVISVYPEMRYSAQANRAFLGRAVTFLAQQGIDQFLDIGSGIPTEGNVHEIAHQINPRSRVVYVDIDPIAVAYSQRILGELPHVVPVVADARDPDTILEHSQTRRLIDFNKPVALLIVAMLHFVPNDTQLHRILGVFREKMIAGSYLVLSHASLDGLPPEIGARVSAIYAKATEQFKARTHSDVLQCFGDFDVIDPGLVDAVDWRPNDPNEWPNKSYYLGGVGRK